MQRYGLVLHLYVITRLDYVHVFLIQDPYIYLSINVTQNLVVISYELETDTGLTEAKCQNRWASSRERRTLRLADYRT